MERRRICRAVRRAVHRGPRHAASPRRRGSQKIDVKICKSFIGGEWITANASEVAPVFNPALGEVIAEVPLAGAELVDLAARAASDAFPDWRDAPAVERAGV